MRAKLRRLVDWQDNPNRDEQITELLRKCPNLTSTEQQVIAKLLGALPDPFPALTTLIERFPEEASSLGVRSDIYRARAKYELALADMTKARELRPDNKGTFHWIPLTLVSECPDKAFREWMLGLADAAVEQDDGAGSRIVRASLLAALPLNDAEEANQQYLYALAAILFRAGEFAEARTQLEAALQVAENDVTSPAYSQLFLAMTQHQLGDEEAARELLRTANQSAAEELAGSPTWNRKLTLELLGKEATSLIGER